MRRFSIRQETATLLAAKEIKSIDEYAAAKQEPAKIPDMFLTEYSNFARKLVKEMEWYAGPLYEAAFPYLSEEQLNIFRQQTDSICSAASELLSKIERTKKL